ncbi:Transposase [Phytophthora megakarya]|uniref:Transposase n=1 Tax=Phytophthora megakarya TaxID=4795 RepID=A0A225UDY4_9STRA|nr:Transposase [Phytophthora megakarya]
MQGVDRHDQLRGRFSLADGHSFQKWHKKLAMAMIDIARCNAYICDGLARGYHGDRNVSTSRTRDPHRTFLIRELFNGEWKNSLENDCGMAYTVSTTPETRPPSTAAATEFHYLPQMCVAKESWKELAGRSRSKRKCTVCSFECRNATQKTDYCSTHQVALCKRSYPVATGKPHLCQQETWTCWQKFHLFYLPKQVYTADGNLRRSSRIYRAQQPFLKVRREQQQKKT